MDFTALYPIGKVAFIYILYIHILYSYKVMENIYRYTFVDRYLSFRMKNPSYYKNTLYIFDYVILYTI